MAKLTKADIESWLIEDGRGIKLVGDYLNAKTKTKFECTQKHRWDTTPSVIKSGSGCPLCAGNVKLSKSDIESWLLKDGRGIKIIGNYVNTDAKTTFECSLGHRWDTATDFVKRGSGCPTCNDTRLTKSDIESRLLRDGRGIKIMGDYVNSQTRTTFECTHGHRWDTTPSVINSGSGCPTCAIDAISLPKITKSDIESRLLRDGRGIKLVGDYVNTNTKATFECSNGHRWSSVIGNLKRGGCPTCADYGFSPSLPAWEYIFTRGSYLKYGISNKLNQRLTTHKKHGDIEVVHLKYHEIGQNAREWENRIKQTFGGKYVTNEICPDGWTETLPISHLKLLREEKLIDKIHST